MTSIFLVNSKYYENSVCMNSRVNLKQKPILYEWDPISKCE